MEYYEAGAFIDGKDIVGSEYSPHKALITVGEADNHRFKPKLKFITPESQGAEGKCTAMACANSMEATVGAVLQTPIKIDPNQIWQYQLNVLKTAKAHKGDHLKNAYRAARKLKQLKAVRLDTNEELTVKLGAYAKPRTVKQAIKYLRKGYALGTAMRSYKNKHTHNSIWYDTGVNAKMPQYHGRDWEIGTSAHAFTLVMEGRKLYMVNSWGNSWGNKGAAEVPYGMLQYMFYFWLPIVTTSSL